MVHGKAPLYTSSGNSTRQIPMAKRNLDFIDLTVSDHEQTRRKIPKNGRNLPQSSTSSQQYSSSSSYSASSSSQPSTQATRLSSQSRPSASSANGGSSQPQRDLWLDEANELDADEVIMMSQDADGNAGETYELYGTILNKIVGIRYYNGHATNGEHVLVRREPGNQYDSNAIRVDNVQRDQIGHIPRTVASKLAPYMDRRDLIVSGVLIGERSEYDCPIAVHLYGTSDPVAQSELKTRMKNDRLPLDGLTKKEREAKKRNTEAMKQAAKKGKVSAAASSKHGFTNSQVGGAPSQAPVDNGPSIEEIMQESQRINPREVGEVVERFGVGEEALSMMPMADTPTRIITELLPYQKQGLAWLLDKENPQLPPATSTDIVQLWKRNPQNPRLFTNIATNFSYKDKEPALASGGILADDMGLGKTLQIIALVVADIERQDESTGSVASPTLILAPVSVMSNWSGQIARHVSAEKPLRVLTYYGPERKPMKSEDFSKYDVVISTYGILSKEYLLNKNKKPAPIPRPSGLYSTKWRRIILDEGHNIRNPKTKGSLAASSLLGTSRWVLTGTPIINNLKDLYSLVRFIGLSGGLERLEIFNAVLIRPLNQGSTDASLLLQALMNTLCLRRKKEMSFVNLRLPKIEEYVNKISFEPHEKEKYQALEAEAKGLFKKFQKRHGVGTEKKQNTYRHLLEILLRLRQVCNHWKLCGERVTSLLSLLDTEKVVKLTPENCAALQEMLQLSIESRDDCPICLETLDNHNPVITHCAHIFGNECISRVIETQHKCPMCRAQLEDENCLVQPAVGLGETTEEIQYDIDTSSSKVEALVGILKASSKKSGPKTKTVVFSQWTKFLDIVQKQLDSHGFQYTRIDGTMNASQRDEALVSLDKDPDCTVMLASLSVCAVGLNLVAANQVILADSWWAPAIEDQAVDRVHRLGQKRETTVFRLVMEDSIEEMVLDIQAEKRKLMMTAFQEKTSKRSAGKSTRIADIERLLK